MAAQDGIRRGRLLAAGCCAAALVWAAGCASDRVRAENDRLREHVQSLEDELEASNRRMLELAQQVNRLTREMQSEPQAGIAADIAAAEPLVTSIALGRLSHAVDDDLDGFADRIVLYLNPADGRGRFMQIVGSLDVQVVAIDADGPRTLGQRSLDPLSVRDAYRSSFTGTHYTIEVDVEPSAGDVTSRAVVLFTDGKTGQTHRAERSIALDTPQPDDSAGDDA